MARPRLQINEEQVKQLAMINCSLAEMAAVLDCSEDTLGRRYADVIKKGRESGKMSLKRKQWEIAQGGNVTMLIWLGKQLLDQSDKRDYAVGGYNGQPISHEVGLTKESQDRIAKLVDAISSDGKLTA